MTPHTLKRLLPLCAITALVWLSAPLSAQLDSPPIYPGKIGFTIAGVQGSAGILCSGFACTAPNLGITRGETLTLTVRSNPKSVYLLLVGPKLAPCISIPGLNNRWVGPSIIALASTVNQRDLLRCWGGVGISTLPVPRTQSLGDSVVFQVVADNSAGPSFSGPVAIVVSR